MVCSIAFVTSKNSSYYINHYYTNDLSEKGWFAGEAAKHFGIENDVLKQKDQRLINTLDGKSPDGTQQLKKLSTTVRTYTDKKTGEKKKQYPVRGMDFCLSDPKEVSILFHLGNNKHVSEEIEKARNKATQEVIDYLHKHFKIRTKSKGANGKDVYTFHKACPIITVFQHHTSRENDPQSHRHIIVSSGAYMKSDPQRGGSLHTRELINMRHTVGQIYLNSLRYELERGKLKLKTYDRPFKEGCGKSFGIHGINPLLCRKLSTRSRQIEKELAKNPDMTKAQLQKVVIETRKKKDKNPDIAKLKAEWNTKGKQYGFNLAKTCPSLFKKETKKQQPPIVKPPQPPTQERSIQQEQKHFGQMVGLLKNKEKIRSHHILAASLNAGEGVKLTIKESKLLANKFTKTYTTKSDRQRGWIFTLKHKAFKLPEACITITQKVARTARILINWHQQKRQNVLKKYKDKWDIRRRKIERRLLGLYLMGKLTRTQYLAFKYPSPLKNQDFRLTVYYTLGIITRKQRDYLASKPIKSISLRSIVRRAFEKKEITKGTANTLLEKNQQTTTKAPIDRQLPKTIDQKREKPFQRTR